MTIHDDLREVMGVLPCPFCGETPIIYDREHHPKRDCWTVICNNDDCPACLVYADRDTEAEAIAAWNTRPALLARQEGEDADAVLAAMNDGYTVRKGLPAPYLTDAANAEFAWIIERAVPPFCDKKGVGMWHAPTPREAIAKARAAIDAARSGGGG